MPPEESGLPTASLPDSSTVIGNQIGHYKLLSVLGEGGFGIVYLAEQKHPIKRQVALKIIKPGMDSKQVIARFEAERQALALLDHPNIAHVFEAGSTESGHPYFVMEYIKGMPITDYCDQHQLKIEDRLKLFIQVCEAVQHAHQKGIIHRDIKPSNIIVSIQDGKAVPKVIDFGVAKAIGMPLTDKTIFTQQSQLIGTPEYMSPEQADMREKDIDTRTDIYSLGIVLYELLAGTLPFEPKTLREAGYAAIQQIIKEQEPPRPSTKLSSLGDDATKIAQNRHTEISTLVNNLHKELEWIPLKAIRKERELRYQSPADLAIDIRHYLNSEPLDAKHRNTWYILRKMIWRRRMAITVGFLCFVAVIVFGTTITIMYQKQLHTTRKVQTAERQNNVRELLNWTLNRLAIGSDEVPNDRYLKILDDLCTRVKAGEADELDLRAFVAATLNIHFKPSQKFIIKGSDIGLSYSADHTLGIGEGLGLLITPILLLDGHLFRDWSTPDLWQPSVWKLGEKQNGSGGYGTSFTMDYEFGPHKLHGNARIQVVEMYKKFYGYPIHGAVAGRDYKEIAGAVVEIPIPEYVFTMVEEYPPNYPTMISDKQYAEEIVRGFVLEYIALEKQDEKSARLHLKFSFPQPKVPIANTLSIYVPKSNWERCYNLTATQQGWSLSYNTGRIISGGGAINQDGRCVVTYDEPLSNNQNYPLRIGDSILITLKPSRQAALDKKLSEYLDVSIEQSGKITEYIPSKD